MKSRSEIEDLKRQWKNDPIWDIEDTEGFEDHKAELLSYRKECEKEWEERRLSDLREKATEMGIPDNLKLTGYILHMEHTIEKLESQLFHLQD